MFSIRQFGERFHGSTKDIPTSVIGVIYSASQFRLADDLGWKHCAFPLVYPHDRKRGAVHYIGQVRYIAINVVITGLDLGDVVRFKITDWINSKGIPFKDANES